jgi:hypothetical protein
VFFEPELIVRAGMAAGSSRLSSTNTFNYTPRAGKEYRSKTANEGTKVLATNPSNGSQRLGKLSLCTYNLMFHVCNTVELAEEFMLKFVLN